MDAVIRGQIDERIKRQMGGVDGWCGLWTFGGAGEREGQTDVGRVTGAGEMR